MLNLINRIMNTFFNSLVKKLVAGILIVSVTTYGTSAFFIFVLKPFLAPQLEDWIYILGVLTLGIMWTCFLGWIAAKLIILPLTRLTRAVNTMASGDLQVQIPNYPWKDEIGSLNASFQVLLDNWRRMIADVSESAAITEQSVAALNEAISQATSQIETVSTTIERMSDAAADQSNSAKELLDTAELSNETSSRMNEQAQHALQISSSMVDTIRESTELFRSIVDSMQHITETSEQTLQFVHALEHQAQEISNISQMVREIANQTHMLALNASIEAAHAGEHGQGFSVVAMQIRKLAADSGSAAEQINELVNMMQKQALTVVAESDRQVDLIRRETEAGESARQVLVKIDTSVHETENALQQIVQGIRLQTEHIQKTYEQARRIADTAKALSEDSVNIAGAAQGQTGVMQEITASSEMLREEAANLKQKTVVFKL